MSCQAVIFPSVAPVHKGPEFSSEMISQALMWEYVKIINTYENWYQIHMEDMSYLYRYFIAHRQLIQDPLRLKNRTNYSTL